jgi:hypothetical protein
MWQYWSHFKYIWIHKYYVFRECLNKGLIWRGITHDLSKFRPSEFTGYSNYFFHTDGTRRNLREFPPTSSQNEKFQQAWCRHQNRNDHHWNYWVVDSHGSHSNPFYKEHECVVMTPGAMVEMVCDWRGAAKAQGTDNAVAYYLKNRERIMLHPFVRTWVEVELGVDKLGRSLLQLG